MVKEPNQVKMRLASLFMGLLVLALVRVEFSLVLCFSGVGGVRWGCGMAWQCLAFGSVSGCLAALMPYPEWRALLLIRTITYVQGDHLARHDSMPLGLAGCPQAMGQ